MKNEMKRYRGVKLAHIVTVCEGEGTSESILRLVEYVLVSTKEGSLVSYGKIVPLNQEEKDFIGSDELK